MANRTAALPRFAWQALIGTLRYCIMVITLAVSAVVFCLLNRTTVHRNGKRTRLATGTIILTNHQSLIDSFLFGLALCFPTILIKPWLQPWHCADRENFFSTKGLRPLVALWKVIPIVRTNGLGQNTVSHRRMLEALRSGTVHLYLEGGRAPTEEMSPPKPGIARIILLTGARVRLAAIRGMHAVQPYKKSSRDHHRTLLTPIGQTVAWIFHFRTGNHVDIIDGPTLTPDEIRILAGEGTINERADCLARELWNRIRELKDCVPSSRNAAA